MPLGLKRNEVKIVPFSSDWKKAFNTAQKQIQKRAGLNHSRIEHIGSTAIEGMHAKPVIDILVGTDTHTPPDKELMRGLQAAGFLRLRVERPEEIICAKFTDNTYQEKTHFVHLVVYKGDLWKDLIFFRDYLNRHEEARKAYSLIKESFVKNASSGINTYTDYKESFVKSIIDKRER
ncbi:MAG TPA: GrpB family protein [Bacillota bacterium]|nr:GrpB family protein [Bacillota bacterium]